MTFLGRFQPKEKRTHGVPEVSSILRRGFSARSEETDCPLKVLHVIRG